MNLFFKTMLKAKKTKAKSFKYKGSTYVGKNHKLLGFIYKKKVVQQKNECRKKFKK